MYESWDISRAATKKRHPCDVATKQQSTFFLSIAWNVIAIVIGSREPFEGGIDEEIDTVETVEDQHHGEHIDEVALAGGALVVLAVYVEEKSENNQVACNKWESACYIVRETLTASPTPQVYRAM